MQNSFPIRPHKFGNRNVPTIWFPRRSSFAPLLSLCLCVFALGAPTHIAFAHGDSLSSATAIPADSTTSGAIDWEGDEDWFEIQLSSSGTLTAYTTGSTDTYGYLIDSGGNTLTYNDDDPYPNFRVSASVGSGTYYVRVRHYSTGTGDYTLYTSFGSDASTTTTSSDGDAGNSTTSALSISPGSGYSDSIDYGGDEDFFQVQLDSSGTLTAYSTGSTDTYGYILDADGYTLAYNDDNPYPNFLVSASVSGGTYYIRVRHYSSSGTGPYTLYTEFSGSTTATGTAGSVALGDALDSSHLSWSTYGDSSWHGQTSVYSTSGSAAASGSISHHQSTSLETSVTGPATVTFTWSVSSESNYDFLSFSIDGVQQSSISGEVGWTTRSFSLPSGSHILRWTYATDGSVLSGSNTGWVDAVQVVSTQTTSSSSTTPDLLFRHPQYGLNAVWFMDANVMQQSAYLLPDLVPDLGWNMVGTGDFNQDGKQDLVWQHNSAGFIGIWFMDGRAYTGAALTNPERVGDVAWRIVGVADFNSDTKPDLLWQHLHTTEIAIWHMDGLNLSWSVLTSPSTPNDSGWKIMGTGDFNRDAHPDLVWQHTSWDYIVLWYMNGAQYTGSSYTSPYSPYDLDWDIVDSADINRDEHPDLLWQHRTYGAIAIWYMNNASMISSSYADPHTPDPWNWQVQTVADFDFAAAQTTDTDDDLMPDTWETQHFGELSRTGAGDYDADGIIDLQEFRSGNTPTAESGLKVFTSLE